MKYIENYEGIKTDIQTIDIDMNEYLQLRLQSLIMKLKQIGPEVIWIDIFIKNTNKGFVYLRKISVRLAIPGQDHIASNVGYRWKSLLKKVERKLIRQLKKRKAMAIKYTRRASTIKKYKRYPSYFCC
ncbi:hypothetical protein OCK74_08715 [Chitinophagaceae bacterium LB-8]|uniref:Ribosomal subunit interface protein n=1 Tax=Paraflavisolibacter caeni TaxID=2982496 RepID=A0A9X2XUM2_9BACT|nr:hypothetical protein [Paraflavisolibacter caeni]MCU7549195.1 hypothetical protein [Paraflavisolibacter caeni]